MDAEDIIEYSEELDDYFEKRHYEDQMHDLFVDPYDNETFWEDLSGRLAERDLIKAIGIDKYRSMESIDRVTQLAKIEEKYSKEFEQNGLEKIHVECEDLISVH